jgi:hypothetical protein
MITGFAGRFSEPPREFIGGRAAKGLEGMLANAVAEP